MLYSLDMVVVYNSQIFYMPPLEELYVSQGSIFETCNFQFLLSNSDGNRDQPKCFRFLSLFVHVGGGFFSRQSSICLLYSWTGTFEQTRFLYVHCLVWESIFWVKREKLNSVLCCVDCEVDYSKLTQTMLSLPTLTLSWSTYQLVYRILVIDKQ